MIKLLIKFIRVDYDQIAKLLLTEALEGAEESNRLSKRLAGRLLVKDGGTSPLAEGVLRLIPEQTKGSLAYQLILLNQDRIMSAINQSLLQKLKGLSLFDLQIIDRNRTVNDVIKLELTLNEIDYNTVCGQLIERLLEKLSQKEGQFGRLAQVFLGLGDVPSDMVAAALSVLSQEAKDQLLIDLFTGCQDDITERINKGLEQQGISAQVEQLKVTKG